MNLNHRMNRRTQNLVCFIDFVPVAHPSGKSVPEITQIMDGPQLLQLRLESFRQPLIGCC